MDEETKKFVSRELTRLLGPGGFGMVLRAALFGKNCQIDWDEVQKAIAYYMPEVERLLD